MNGERPLPPGAPGSSTPNPWLSAGLSFMLPGAGQAFHGRFWKGTLLLCLSFVALPAVTLCLVYFGGLAGIAIIPPLLVPWVYSMVNAAREADRMSRESVRHDSRKGAIFVSILLLVVFPSIAFVFSLITLLLLPYEILSRLAVWSERFRRMLGLEG